jgi:tetratricopeptide (TPR) repeat protein
MTNSAGDGSVTDPQSWKEKGNLAFKNGDWDEACECYTRAIKQTKEDTPEKAVYYKNRAAVHLKKCEYTEARDDCTSALDIVANDPKALFRRCQALEALEKFEEAYRDARNIHTVDPGNKAIQPILERLHQTVQDRMQQNAQTTNKVAQMFGYAFNMEEEKEKREFVRLCCERPPSFSCLAAGFWSTSLTSML